MKINSFNLSSTTHNSKPLQENLKKQNELEKNDLKEMQNWFHEVPKKGDALAIMLTLQVQVSYGIKNNTIFQRAFGTSGDANERAELRNFMLKNPIDRFDVKDNTVLMPKYFTEDLARLLADDEISIDDFKKEYLKIKENIDNAMDNEEIEEKDEKFKPIEAKSDNINESMEEILGKLNMQKFKDDKDLITLLLAYKDGENLYEKRV